VLCFCKLHAVNLNLLVSAVLYSTVQVTTEKAKRLIMHDSKLGFVLKMLGVLELQWTS